MNVDHAVVIFLRQIEEAQPTGKADEIDVGVIDQVENAPAEGRNVGKRFSIDDFAGNSSGFGALDAG